jgi:hypothetical protein
MRYTSLINFYGMSYTPHILDGTVRGPLFISILLIKTLGSRVAMRFDVWVDRSDTVRDLCAAW